MHDFSYGGLFFGRGVFFLLRLAPGGRRLESGEFACEDRMDRLSGNTTTGLRRVSAIKNRQFSVVVLEYWEYNKKGAFPKV